MAGRVPPLSYTIGGRSIPRQDAEAVLCTWSANDGRVSASDGLMLSDTVGSKYYLASKRRLVA